MIMAFEKCSALLVLIEKPPLTLSKVNTSSLNKWLYDLQNGLIVLLNFLLTQHLLKMDKLEYHKSFSQDKEWQAVHQVLTNSQ